MVAYIVGKPGFRHEDIAAHCRTQIPADRRPKMIYYLEQIPRTGNDKIDRPALKAAAAREAQTEAAAMPSPVHMQNKPVIFDPARKR
jgi:acyl-coenzyme A synthetase/AMP-(fatty) acid ligase